MLAEVLTYKLVIGVLRQEPCDGVVLVQAVIIIYLGHCFWSSVIVVDEQCCVLMFLKQRTQAIGKKSPLPIHSFFKTFDN